MSTRQSRDARTDTRRRKARAVGSKREISASLIKVVCQRLARNQRVRRTLPARGRLHIDRQLPFLCVYRQRPHPEDVGTVRLVKGEASYLVAPDAPKLRQSVATLVREVVRTLSAEFGGFLIVELWSAPDGGQANDPAVPTVLPTFVVHASNSAGMTRTVEALASELSRVKVLKQAVEVELMRDGRGHPPGTRPLLTRAEARELNCHFIGLTVPPVYRKANSADEFPLVARSLRRSLSLALRHGYFEFSRSRTTHRPAHYHALGRRAVVKAVWDIDRRLASVSEQFDYLLQLTPVNISAAWREFRRGRFARAPLFHYRPLPVDPDVLKRRLYQIPIERVEDPALQRLFKEKREEIELKLTMLRDRDSPRFVHESLQLFGGVDDDLMALANELLEVLPRASRSKKPPGISAAAFLQRVEAEFEFYRQGSPEFTARARVVDDVTGLFVSGNTLLINSEVSLPPARVEALLAHEVGTHLLTYHNGRQQPFQQLHTGLAGYEELQEGLAVLAEYLVGGLSRARMRYLAARVVAVRLLTHGASFAETFRVLDRDHGFKQRTAYNITMRVYRGGGLSKDAVYLRGLVAVLAYVQQGGDVNTLLVGKLAAEYISIIKELQYRNVLGPVPVLPRYLRDGAALERLEQLRGSTGSVVDLVHPVAASSPLTGER